MTTAQWTKEERAAAMEAAGKAEAKRAEGSRALLAPLDTALAWPVPAPGHWLGTSDGWSAFAMWAHDASLADELGAGEEDRDAEARQSTGDADRDGEEDGACDSGVVCESGAAAESGAATESGAAAAAGETETETE